MEPWFQEQIDTVEAALQELFSRKRKGEVVEPTLFSAVESLTMRGGKRLRPLLFSATTEALRSTKECPASSTDVRAWLGAALELLQTYLLIHDDWMDQDLERRGGPSTLAHFRSLSEGSLAASQTVLAGDLASAWAWEALLEAPLDAASHREVSKCFTKIQHDVVIGQYLDVCESEDVLLVYELKTGSYTTWGPLQLACAACGAPDALRLQLETFARPLGLAFQLRDELIDITEPQSETGKPQGSDLRSGKRTRIRQLALRQLGTAFIERAQDPTTSTTRLLNELSRAKIPQAVESELSEHYAIACEALERLPCDTTHLSRLAQMMVERTR